MLRRRSIRGQYVPQHHVPSFNISDPSPPSVLRRGGRPAKPPQATSSRRPHGFTPKGKSTRHEGEGGSQDSCSTNQFGKNDCAPVYSRPSPLRHTHETHALRPSYWSTENCIQRDVQALQACFYLGGRSSNRYRHQQEEPKKQKYVLYAKHEANHRRISCKTTTTLP